MPLLVECIESAEGFAALALEWQRLFVSSGSHLPFWTFDWAQSWWSSCRRRSWVTRDALRIHTVREPSGVLVGVAPMMLTERPSRGPLRVRCLQFLGADPNLTELKGVICSPANALRVHQSLLLHFRRHVGEWDWLQWASVDPRCADLLADQRDALWQREVPAYMLALPDSWEAFKHGLKRNVCESLRKCYNSLKRDGHEFEFHVAHEPAHVASMLAHLFRLHYARSSVRGTVVHADVFASAHSRRFLLEVCERLARRGHWRAFTLRIAGQVVAIRLGFRFDDALYLYYSGYDPPWGRYSVMTTTVAEAIKHSISDGIRVVNLSTGNDLSKTRWGPTEVTTLDVTLCAPRVRSRLAHWAYRGSRKRAFPV